MSYKDVQLLAGAIGFSSFLCLALIDWKIAALLFAIKIADMLTVKAYDMKIREIMSAKGKGHARTF